MMANFYKKILTNNNLSSRKKAKRLALYYARKRGAKKSWNKRHRKVFAAHSSYSDPCEEVVESNHQQIWSAFRNNVDMSTIRICKNISGNADARMIPEDIFVSDIEPSLISDTAGHFQSHKSFYNRWFKDEVFPRCIFHNIEGQYLDSDLNSISFHDLIKQAKDISYPVVVKPNWDSYGGKEVSFINNLESLVQLCDKNSNFVVQEKINQHDFFKKYNRAGLNTIRVYVYKSVKDNACHILSMAMRMGVGGDLDNLSAGGIQTMIKSNGYLNNYAVDKYGKKYSEHPDTGYVFDKKIPSSEKLKKRALKIGDQIFFNRIVGLDLCYDESDQWRVIEVNTKGHSIRFSQYGGQPFLGDFTDEVIEYCKQNHWTLNKSL